MFQRFDASGEDRGERYFYNAAGYLNEVREARYAVGATVYHKVVAMDARGNVIRAALGNGTDIQRFSKGSGRATCIAPFFSDMLNEWPGRCESSSKALSTM